MLKVNGLCKSYGEKKALYNFSYEFMNGVYGLLGANGVGKSTLMNLLTDNIKRDAGQILYDGTEVLKNGSKYRELIGYMPQQQGFYEHFSARAFLFYMAELKGIRKKEAGEQIGILLKMVHLDKVADKKIGGVPVG